MTAGNLVTSECLREQQSQQPDNQPDVYPLANLTSVRGRYVRKLGEVNVARVQSSTTEDASVSSLTRDSMGRDWGE